MDRNIEERADSRNVECDFLSFKSNVETQSVIGPIEVVKSLAEIRDQDIIVDSNVVPEETIDQDTDDAIEESRLSTSSELDKDENIDEKVDLLSLQEDTVCYNDLIFEQDTEGDNILFLSIIGGHTDLAMCLIALASDPHGFSQCNMLMQTALHLATVMNLTKVARRLIVAGMDVDRRDRQGNTALHIACKLGFVDIVRALLSPVTYPETKLNSYEIPYQKIPQNLEIRNSDGLTCLHLAVMNGNLDIIQVLLSTGADVNAREMKAGKTCLHIAAENGDNRTLCELLHHSKIKIDKETFAGYTAADLARYRDHVDIEITMIAAGASPSRSIETVEQSRVFNDDCGNLEIIIISSDDGDDDDDDNDDDDNVQALLNVV